jgi:hypothetical protein
VQKQPETPKKQRNRSSRPPLQSNYKARTGRDSERGTTQATEFIKYLVTPRKENFRYCFPKDSPASVTTRTESKGMRVK